MLCALDAFESLDFKSPLILEFNNDQRKASNLGIYSALGNAAFNTFFIIGIGILSL
jgi:hypothetical protein